MRMWSCKDIYLNLSVVCGKYQLRAMHPIYTDDVDKCLFSSEDKAAAEQEYDKYHAMFQKTMKFDVNKCHLPIKLSTLIKILTISHPHVPLLFNNRFVCDNIKIWTIGDKQNGYCYYSITDSVVWQCSENWLNIFNYIIDEIPKNEKEAEKLCATTTTTIQI